MNYLRNIFSSKKKINPDSLIIANELFYGKEKLALNDVNIDKIIKQNKIPVKMNASLKKDIEDEYYRLNQIKQNDTRMYNEERAYTKQERDLDAIRNKYRPQKPVSMTSGEDEDVWVDTSSSIEGGARRKRSTKSTRRKSKKTRKHRKKRA